MPEAKWIFRSPIGTFSIEQSDAYDFDIFQDGEPIDVGYPTAEQALVELTGGYVPLASGDDVSVAGLPDDLDGWPKPD
jgi:hypothetical protein